LIASLAKAGGVIIDKYFLSFKGMKTSKFIVWLFLFLAIFTFPFLIFDNSINLSQIGLFELGLFGLMIFLAGSWNILYYRSIKNDSVQEFEPILMLSPLIVILITPLFYPQEASKIIFFLAVIAGFSLVFSHLEQDHLKFSKDSLGLLLAMILMSLEIIIIRELLFVFSPASLYFFRCFSLLIVYLIIYRKTVVSVNQVSYLPVALTSLLGVAQMLLSFYGYQKAGLVFTTLILIVAPILVYLYCFLVLKEELKPKKIVGAIIILACVSAAYLLN
jgi:drug/metabolite transporter (DMT)-like permease